MSAIRALKETIQSASRSYDVVARVEAASIDALGNLVVSKIQAVEGVSRTLTCPVVRL